MKELSWENGVLKDSKSTLEMKQRAKSRIMVVTESINTLNKFRSGKINHTNMQSGGYSEEDLEKAFNWMDENARRIQPVTQ